MELFASNETVSTLEQALSDRTDVASIAMQLELAWYLRQRDGQRALRMCEVIEQLLATYQLNAGEQKKIQARLQLIRAENDWLTTNFDNARQQIDIALQLFSDIADHPGLADTHWLAAQIEADAGEIQLQQQELALCMVQAELAQDKIRYEIANACIARQNVLRMHHPDEEQWVRHFESLTIYQNQGLLTWVFDFLGVQAGQYSDFATATTQLIRATEAAANSGQITRAIVISANICYSLAGLRDTEGSLKWGQHALKLARQKDWPISLGISLTQTADAFRKIDQLDSAKELLNEALQTLHNVTESRSYVIALRSLSDIALAQLEFHNAYNYFKRLESHPVARLQQDFQCIALRGQAQALLHLNQIDAALEAAQTALTIANANNYPDYQIASLWALADIFSAHPELRSTKLNQGVSSLQFLLQAVEIGEKIQDYAISDKLYARIAAEYATLADFSNAYAYSLLAFSSREKSLNIDVKNSAIALQLRLQTEKAISESEHHKAIVEEQQRRATILEQANETLCVLGTIGQEITTQLQIDNIYQVISHHVNALLDVTHFSIFLLDSTGSTLTLTYGMEAGKRLPQHQFSVDDQIYYSSRCIRERREILVDNFETINAAAQLPDTLKMESLLFSPLIVANRIIGVMTMQSRRKRAYGEREQLIFRTLCSYSAIALDNAHAYSQLMDARNQLVDQEKMAALGSLVAGVAHEMNTPIGNSLLIASTISERTKTLSSLIENQNLKRTELLDYLDNVKEGSKLILNGLTTAATMLSSFKQVAVDRNTEHKRQFNLRTTCQDIAASIRNRITNSGHELQLLIPDDIEMKSYPGPLGQVVTNMIENALLHAFADRSHGHMIIAAERYGTDQIRLQFSDDGNGISEKNIGHIFEPFFSTRFGQGGSGLGLSISYNIITSILHGQLNVKSKVGEGTCFTMLLPIEAPDMKD
ncbi:ATP-binding protein [Undibacterium sp. Dicai25W]|uniref:ATP-binding protein n=1 Tax=Undibacterium sp. Dicai25W TaxID=3413034 RepID=UPI003BF012C1